VHYSVPHDLWVLTRHADVTAAVLDADTFSSARGISFTNEQEELPLLPNLVMMDPPRHTKYRRLLNRGFSPRRVEELEPDVRRFVTRCLDDLVDQGGDFIGLLARPLPCFVVAHYLGVPEADRGLFEAWTGAIVQANAAGAMLSAADALAELYGYFTGLVERRHREPGDDVVSALAHAGPEGIGLSTEEILGYAFVMIAGGNDTATGLLAGSAELLAAHPDQRRRLQDDGSSISAAVEELLRLTSPVQGLCRVTTRAVEVSGTEIPAGSRVLLCYGAANRDPRQFGDDAEQLDVARAPKRVLSFGGGPHYCLGAQAARLQGRVVVEELLRRCPDFTVDAEGGRFADGPFVRRYQSLPFHPGPARPR
jgi:cytochrome P450